MQRSLRRDAVFGGRCGFCWSALRYFVGHAAFFWCTAVFYFGALCFLGCDAVFGGATRHATSLQRSQGDSPPGDEGVFAVFAKIPPPILSNHMCVSCPPIPISHVCIPCPPIPSAILPIMPAHHASHVCVSCAPILPTMGACDASPHALRLRRSFHAIMNFPFFLLTSRDVFSAFEGGEDARHALLCGAIRVNLGLGF